jgi:phage/plasmid-like protein (TIGR03299 family)
MYVKSPNGYVEVPNRKAIIRDDSYEVLGVPSSRYTPHQYDDVLLSAVSNILDDDLSIGSAGVLKGGAIAFVQVEMPENVKGAGGVEFRPNLLATTSFNGSIATTYKRTVTIVVCDNTRDAALREDGEAYTVRHTANSSLRLQDARTALKVVHTMADDFQRELEALLSQKVTDKQYEKFVAKYVPTPTKDAQQAVTRAENTRSILRNLWTNDERVTPWKGTAYGVLQAVNTYRHHFRPTRGGTVLAERNYLDALTGKTGAADIEALKVLANFR